MEIQESKRIPLGDYRLHPFSSAQVQGIANGPAWVISEQVASLEHEIPIIQVSALLSR